MKEKSIYFLRPVGERGPIKIGCSQTPQKRLRSVEIWSPVQLEIVAFCPGGHMQESVLHQMFGDQRRHGEWFDVTPELESLIAHVIFSGQLPELDGLSGHAKRRSNPTARSKMARRGNSKVTATKFNISYNLHQAERRVYGFRGERFMRPTEIEEIVQSYQGFDSPLPTCEQRALIEEYIDRLGDLPAFDRSFDTWLEWHKAVPKAAPTPRTADAA